MTHDEKLIERFHVLSERLDRAWAKFMARKVSPVVINPQQKKEE